MKQITHYRTSSGNTLCMEGVSFETNLRGTRKAKYVNCDKCKARMTSLSVLTVAEKRRREAYRLFIAQGFTPQDARKLRDRSKSLNLCRCTCGGCTCKKYHLNFG